ncbi:unnamed protein product, partial [Cladocopium goreaui]
VGGIRGMTAVQSPTGTGSSILFCWNPNSTSKSWILRCDFDGEKKLMQPIEETSINAEAKKYLQTEDLAYTLAAYNNMLPSQVGKHQCNLIGFEIVVYGGGLKKLQLDQVKEKHAYWAGAGIACRVNGHDYFVIEVGGVGGTGQALTAVRCFENSPFPEVRRGGKMLDMIITDTEGAKHHLLRWLRLQQLPIESHRLDLEVHSCLGHRVPKFCAKARPDPRQESAVEDCSRVAALGSLQALGNSLESALLEQSSDSAQLKRVAAQLSPDVSQAATVPLKVLSVSAELRVELAIEAPWLPLELVLFRDGQEEKAWASAHFAGQRLVMLLPSLPKGQYQLKLSYWSPAGTGAAGAAQRHCAALLGTVALLAAKGRDTSNYRQERYAFCH